LLRDSLEKQGIIVQDLSVSVRQDSRQPYENGQQHRGLTGVRHKGASPPAAAVIPDAAGLAEASVIVDPWLWQGSTINLTA
jgi:flagellar hook-length control protein FliK